MVAHSPASIDTKGYHVVNIQLLFLPRQIVEYLVRLYLVEQLPDHSQVVVDFAVAEERDGVELEPRERAPVFGFGGFTLVSSVSTCRAVPLDIQDIIASLNAIRS
jgi:hypothetical protein